ncbi:hypothetical protein KR222_004781 [Zaprionus bogoriensis]|nr:hypothetical protein KR222_004781 [Zaprionus bogoriensis]
MEQHKSLLKTRLGGSDHLLRNRENQRVARKKWREDTFLNNRVITVSRTKEMPTPTTAAAAAAQTMQTMQTTHEENSSEQENKDPQLSVATGTSETSRKKDYLNRFMQWRTEQKQLKARERAQRQPVSSVAAQQPAQQPAEAVFAPPQRRSLYVVVDLKSKTSGNAKQLEATARTQAAAINSKCAPTTRVQPKVGNESNTAPPINGIKPKPPAAVKKPPAAALAAAAPNARPDGSSDSSNSRATAAIRRAAYAACIKPMRTVSAKKPPAACAPATVAAKPAALANKPPSATANKAATKPATTCVQPAGAAPSATTKEKTHREPAGAVARPVNLVTQPFDKPANCAKPIRAGGGGGGGAAGKFKLNANPPLRAVKSSAQSQLSKRMKVKKPDAGNNKQKLSEQVMQLRQALYGKEETLPVTPLDRLSIDNPFQATSTQYKSNNASHGLLELYKDLTKLSPLAADDTATPSASSSKSVAKRQLLTEEIAKAGQAQEQQESKKKFNFTRYSICEPLLDSVDSVAAVVTISDQPEQDVEKVTTPPSGHSASKPNYLSPFVSVSRGKVSSQAERTRRDSMYLQDQEHQQAEQDVAVRRTLESVQYFRLQLQNEIGRLNALCDEWELYSSGENAELLAETGGKDMIDAAIGQTKLLTSKKMMQFSSLIDRCEAGATGVGLRPNDGSEATKPVLAEDLEGWWDMMRLQSDNVDKRFDNLQRWKANNWQDPDEVATPKPKTKVKAKAKRKAAAKGAEPTSKASRDLKSFLLKANAEARRKRQDQRQNGESSVQLINNTPKRQVIVVRDRKSFSPARTVLRLTTDGGAAGGSRTPIGGNTLLKSAIMGAVAVQEARQSQQLQTPPTPQPQTPPPSESKRMSILKTPGTKKQEQHSARRVIFSAKKKVRRFQFAVEEGEILDDEEPQQAVEQLDDCEEDMSMERNSSTGQNSQAKNENTPQAKNENTPQPTPVKILRTCVLRNRDIMMRHSSEFMYN